MRFDADPITRVIVLVIKSLRRAQDYSSDFIADMLNYARWLQDNKMSKSEFVDEVSSLMRTWASKTYQEGSGVSRTLDERDDKLVNDWVEGQVSHLVGLSEAIYAEGLTPRVQDRIRMWAASMGSLASMGYMQSNRSKLAYWVKGPTEIGCSDCEKLDGIENTLGWFLDRGYLPGQPGSSILSCGGWQCRCRILDAETHRKILPIITRWRYKL